MTQPLDLNRVANAPIKLHALHPPPSADPTQRDICCRTFAPALPEYSAASVRIIAPALTPGAIVDIWAEEVGRLMPLSRPFDGFVEYAKRVSPTCLVHLDRTRYSAAGVVRQSSVSLRAYPERIVVVAEGQIVCEHRRVFARSHERKSTTTVYDWRHYLAVIQRKPGALRNGAPFVELPPAFRALQQRMLKTPGGDREMVEILALVLQHDEQAVLAAIELALEAGVPTKTHILNLLHRLVDGKPTNTPPIKAPQALTLTTEPRADVERYDALRKVREARHAS